MSQRNQRLKHLEIRKNGKKQRILKERARILADEITKEVALENYLQVVEFLLGDERYGFETEYVREIFPVKYITALPGVSKFIRGVINLRGQILSVFNLRNLYDLPEQEMTELSRVIVLEVGNVEFGILADRVLGISLIGLENIQLPLPTLVGVREEYLKGITESGLMILSANKLLQDPKFVLNEKAT